MTRIGTVTAHQADNAVTIALTVTPAEFLDLVSGLAWVDVLGGFGTWRTILPTPETPARIAGHFTLRRTYDNDQRSQAAEPRPTPAAAEDPRGATAAPGDGANEARSRDLRPQRDGETDSGGYVAPPAVVAEPAGEHPQQVEIVRCSNGPCLIRKGSLCSCPRGSYAQSRPAGEEHEKRCHCDRCYRQRWEAAVLQGRPHA